jgi:hypothetical protein
MALDLSKLSDQDLEAIASGDMSRVSDVGLQSIAGDAAPPAPTSTTTKKKDDRGVMGGIADFMAGAASLPAGAVNMVSRRLGYGDAIDTSIARGIPVDKESWSYLGGQIADPAAMAVGGGAFKAAQQLPRIGAIGKGMIGGAAGGANIAALSGQEDIGAQTIAGGVVGAAIPGIGRVAGGAADWMGGNRPTMEASKIIKAALGNRESAVRRSLENADLTAGGAQRDIAQIIYKDAPDQALALLERAKGYAPNAPDAARQLAEAQTAAQQAQLGRVAGGTTQEASLAAQKRMGQALNQQLNPDRVANLTAANIYNQQAARDLPTAALYKGNALYPHSQKTTTGGFPQDVKVDTGQSELYAAAAKTIEDKLGSLQANGLKPLTIDPIIKKIDRILSTPGQRGSLNQEYLQAVRQELIDYSKMAGGKLDAFDLHTLRKEGLNNVIDRITKGVEDPSGLKKNLAKNVLPTLKDAIDDAIETAGGTGWKSYLNRFSLGMNQIDRAKMGQMALEMTPKNLIKLAEGNAPKKVAKVFGPSAGTFEREMGQEGMLIRDVARQYARDMEIAKRGGSKEAQEVLKNTLSQNTSSFRLPPILNRSAVLANATLQEIEGRLNQKALTVLGGIRTDPKKALALLDTLPADQKNLVLQYMTQSKLSAPVISGVTGMLSGE